MKASPRIILRRSLSVGLLSLLVCASARAAETDSLAGALKYLGQYTWEQDRAPLAPIDRAIVDSAGDADARAKLEDSLTAILRVKSSAAARDAVCRRLARIGSARSVPALAALLSDPAFSDMARYALERIDAEEADDALRRALPALSGRQRIGVVNSLGVRRDGKSAGLIAGLLKSGDVELVSAAIAALGRIGTTDCASPLLDICETAKPPVRNACASALLAVAETTLSGGNRPLAEKIYTRLTTDGMPLHVRVGGLRGLLLADPKGAPQRLLGVLRSGDACFAPYVCTLVSEMTAPDAARQLAAGLPSLDSARRVCLLNALAILGDSAARGAVRTAAKGTDGAVRVAALQALERLGNTEDVALLTAAAASDKEAESAAALRGLTKLRGMGIGNAILGEAAKAAPATRAVLLHCLADRNESEAAGRVATFLGDANGAVRLAALESLGELGDSTQLGTLLTYIERPSDSKERRTAEKALADISTREGNAASAVLVAALKTAEKTARLSALKALGKAGGKRALDAVVATAGDSAAIGDDAVRVLSNWQNAEAAPHLLALAGSGNTLTRKVLALRGYVRLVGQSKAIKDSDKVARLSEAMAAAPRVDEKKLVLGAYAGVACQASLDKVLTFASDKQLGDEACNAAVRICETLVKKQKGPVRDAMKQVVEKTRSEKIRKSAQKLLKKAEE